MNFKFNGETRTLPDSLSQITLEQKINFQKLHGEALEKQRLAIDAMTSKGDKEVEDFLWLADSAYAWLAFFGGIDIEVFKEEAVIGQVLNLYTVNQTVLQAQEIALVLEEQYAFEGELWEIVPPTEEVPTEKTSLKQFELMKSVVLDLISLGNGNWDKLPALCALYLRKAGESTADVVKVADERKVRFLKLPLDIALTVGHYLKDTMSMFMQSLKEFENQEPEP